MRICDTVSIIFMLQRKFTRVIESLMHARIRLYGCTFGAGGCYITASPGETYPQDIQLEISGWLLASDSCKDLSSCKRTKPNRKRGIN